MKIYAITINPKTEIAYTFLTASIDAAKYSKEYSINNNADFEIKEYEVKTQGKNFNDIALPKKSTI